MVTFFPAFGYHWQLSGFGLELFFGKVDEMDPKIGILIVAIILSIALFLIGGFVLGKAGGMVCVLIGITVVGLAAGNIMNSPEPDNCKEYE
ncbi:MAG: hypothetical protein WA435_00085 [Gallionellaceae bacterium]